MFSGPASPRSPSKAGVSSPQHPPAPAHNVFAFDNIIFSSNFDNGNLGRVERVPNRPYEFKVWTAPDNMGTEFQSKHCAWFHFSVTGLPMGCVLRIQLVNASNHSGLYKHDMRPVYRSNSTNQKWVRIRSSVRFIKEGENSQLYFEHSVDAENDKIYFSFTYPYSYSQMQSELAGYDMHVNRMDAPGSLFYQRELFAYSCDKRRLDLLTITSVDGASAEKEPLLPGLFPDTMSPSQSRRPPIFPNKEVIIVSARVHPGEVPAQHTFKGVLSLLMDPEDQTARELRARYVFKLIPMLNPDGVFRGHFRMDQHGHNLNRYYNNPDPNLQPTIFAAKSLLDYYAQTGRVSMYLDMHAHASKRGCFIYGNVLDQVEDQIQNQLYCKLISMNSPHFDYEGCLFSREHMFRTDPGDQAKGLTAEGSGRVHTYLAYGLVHSYTLECNYNTSRIGNEVAQPEQEILGQNVTPASNFTTNPEKYTPSSWAGVGRACIVAMLDIRGQNPCSRIPKSKFKTLDRVRNAVVMEVRNRKEYQGKQMSRERRRSIADKKLAGSSATQSDEFLWRRVVDGYEVVPSGTRSGANSARSSGTSLTLAAAATAAMEQQTRATNNENNSNNNANAVSYLFIPAGKEKRRKTLAVPSKSNANGDNSTCSNTPRNAGKERAVGISGIAVDSEAATVASTTSTITNASTTVPISSRSNKPPVSKSLEQQSPTSDLNEIAEISATKEKYQHLERLILESQSARITAYKSFSPPQHKDSNSTILVAHDDSDAELTLNTSPSKMLHGPLIGNTTKQMQQYFHALNSTNDENLDGIAATSPFQKPFTTQIKSNRPRSADILKSDNSSRRERNNCSQHNNSNVTVEILLPSSSRREEGEDIACIKSGNHHQNNNMHYNGDNCNASSSPQGTGIAESRNSKSSESSRLGVGASIRDLIREQSIQKLIKLSSHSSPPHQASSSNNSSSSSMRKGSNAVPQGTNSPSTSKDNRKILGKTLHAAGVALLMSNLVGATSSESNANNLQGNNNLLSVQGMSATSRNSSNVSLQPSLPDTHIPVPIPHR